LFFVDFNSLFLFLLQYIPTLAKEIVDRNEAGQQPILSNFKGFLVGNPYTNFYSGIPSGMETFWGHQVVSKPLYDDYTKNCVNARPLNVSDIPRLFCISSLLFSSLLLFIFSF
jgi:hypothetical protein